MLIKFVADEDISCGDALVLDPATNKVRKIREEDLAKSIDNHIEDAEKVLRVRVQGFAIDKQMFDGSPYIISSQAYRFIGNDEVETAEQRIIDDWMHYSVPQAAPYELHFKFERLDLGKELNYSLTREYIDNGTHALVSLRERIKRAIGDCK